MVVNKFQVEMDKHKMKKRKESYMFSWRKPNYMGTQFTKGMELKKPNPYDPIETQYPCIPYTAWNNFVDKKNLENDITVGVPNDIKLREYKGVYNRAGQGCK